MQRDQPPTGIADDAGRVIGPHDDPQRRHQRALAHVMHHRRILDTHSLLEDVDRLVHLGTVLVRGPVPVQVTS